MNKYFYKMVTCPHCKKDVAIYRGAISGFGNRETETIDCPYCGAEKIYEEFTNEILFASSSNSIV